MTCLERKNAYTAHRLCNFSKVPGFSVDLLQPCSYHSCGVGAAGAKRDSSFRRPQLMHRGIYSRNYDHLICRESGEAKSDSNVAQLQN